MNSMFARVSFLHLVTSFLNSIRFHLYLIKEGESDTHICK